MVYVVVIIVVVAITTELDKKKNAVAKKEVPLKKQDIDEPNQDNEITDFEEEEIVDSKCDTSISTNDI